MIGGTKVTARLEMISCIPIVPRPVVIAVAPLPLIQPLLPLHLVPLDSLDVTTHLVSVQSMEEWDTAAARRET